MGRQRHSKESIVQILQNLAKSLGKDSLTKQQVQTVMPSSSIEYHFGSLGNSLEAAGLQRRSAIDVLNEIRPVALTDGDLFRSMLELEQRLGHPPGQNEYNSGGEYSAVTFRRRFGKWPNVLAHYRKWKSDNNVETARQASGADQDQPAQNTSAKKGRHVTNMGVVRSARTQRNDGEPIDFRGLRHAPINEQGVVYLLGWSAGS